MPDHRLPEGKQIPFQIGTDEEYRQALKKLELLQSVPLGTDLTEGLQNLIEAILDYEAKQGRMDCGSLMQ